MLLILTSIINEEGAIFICLLGRMSWVERISLDHLMGQTPISSCILSSHYCFVLSNGKIWKIQDWLIENSLFWSLFCYLEIFAWSRVFSRLPSAVTFLSSFLWKITFSWSYLNECANIVSRQISFFLPTLFSTRFLPPPDTLIKKFCSRHCQMIIVKWGTNLLITRQEESRTMFQGIC